MSAVKFGLCYEDLFRSFRDLIFIGCTQPVNHHLLARNASIQIEVGLDTHLYFLHLIILVFHSGTPLSFKMNSVYPENVTTLWTIYEEKRKYSFIQKSICLYM